jgi:hypothetical protein
MKFKYEHITPKPNTVFKKEKQLEKDCIALWKEKEYNPSHPVSIDTGSFLSNQQKVFERNHSFEWELFQWADTDFVSWVNEQPPTMVLAVMAEMKQSPQLRPDLEKLRQKVHEVPLCSMELYCQKKKLGERSIHFLKEMKKRYGESILRILYLTSG